MQRFSAVIRRALLVAAVAAAGFVGSAGAQQGSGQARLTPAEIPWPKAAGAGAGTSGASGIHIVLPLPAGHAMPGVHKRETRQ